ncbi:4212_t:CDS:2 [Diversispora eburnea]|uniref:4212_t:CDS:1 n=1 Tax=Diversispora eburnea TaxID=1213867 RepID=A0A9N8V4F8_9GLOM|nr:4212_t:CDS:2 [Diversispora eburnea]
MSEENIDNVEAVTANTTDAVTEAVEPVTPTETEEKAQEEIDHKVFVGNLAFQTTETTLAEFFGKTGSVIKANIITRGTRSLGYGFVALETDEDVKKVVEELNKKELEGRQINVEVAKPKNENADHSHQGWNTGPRPRRRGGWQGRRRFRHNINENNNNVEDSVNSSVPNTNGDIDTSHVMRGGGEPSKTVVFVANLPFSIDNEGLKEIFKDYDVASAHVVRRRGGRSKGFGFVTLANEEEQKKALDGLKSAASEGRELVIKVALSDQHHIQPGDETEIEKSDAPAISSDERKEEEDE